MQTQLSKKELQQLVVRRNRMRLCLEVTEYGAVRMSTTKFDPILTVTAVDGMIMASIHRAPYSMFSNDIEYLLRPMPILQCVDELVHNHAGYDSVCFPENEAGLTAAISILIELFVDTFDR